MDGDIGGRGVLSLAFARPFSVVDSTHPVEALDAVRLVVVEHVGRGEAALSLAGRTSNYSGCRPFARYFPGPRSSHS